MAIIFGWPSWRLCWENEPRGDASKNIEAVLVAKLGKIIWALFELRNMLASCFSRIPYSGDSLGLLGLVPPSIHQLLGLLGAFTICHARKHEIQIELDDFVAIFRGRYLLSLPQLELRSCLRSNLLWRSNPGRFGSEPLKPLTGMNSSLLSLTRTILSVIVRILCMRAQCTACLGAGCPLGGPHISYA